MASGFTGFSHLFGNYLYFLFFISKSLIGPFVNV